MPARVASGSLQIRFEDEKGLAELVEALEMATASSRTSRVAASSSAARALQFPTPGD